MWHGAAAQATKEEAAARGALSTPSTAHPRSNNTLDGIFTFTDVDYAAVSDNVARNGNNNNGNIELQRAFNVTVQANEVDGNIAIGYESSEGAANDVVAHNHMRDQLSIYAVHNSYVEGNDADYLDLQNSYGVTVTNNTVNNIHFCAPPPRAVPRPHAGAADELRARQTIWPMWRCRTTWRTT